VEGLVWSLMSDRDLLEAPMARILSGRPESVTSHFRMSYSTLLHLVADLGRERVPEAWEKSFECFQHRDRRPKAQQKSRRQGRRTIDARLTFLDELRFLANGDELTPRGRVARLISGYEIQITELLFEGALEDLPPPALAMIFVAQIHEERRRGDERWIPKSLFGDERRRVDRVLHRLTGKEASLGIPNPLKLCDWGLTRATLAWCEGASMEDLESLTDAAPGDVCRVFRMAIQLLRQVKHAIDPAWDLHARVQDAMNVLNRDEVDARRQLELG
jgi:superfamily II RNA helicase